MHFAALKYVRIFLSDVLALQNYLHFLMHIEQEILITRGPQVDIFCSLVPMLNQQRIVIYSSMKSNKIIPLEVSKQQFF